MKLLLVEDEKRMADALVEILQMENYNVEVYMTFTRKKLKFVGSTVEIKAVRGLGYELRCQDV